MRAVSFVVAMMLCFGGCYTTKMYHANATASRTKRSAVEHSLLWGMVPMNDVNLDNLCGDKGFSDLKTSINGWGIVVNFLTVGIYTPITVKATCAE